MSEVVDLTDDLQPWERPEWRARCEAERNDGVISAVAAFARATHGFSLHDACDEEMWRKVHDPPGAARMLYTRMMVHLGEDPSNPETADKIQKLVDEKRRALELAAHSAPTAAPVPMSARGRIPRNGTEGVTHGATPRQ